MNCAANWRLAREVFRKLAIQKENRIEEWHLMADHVHMTDGAIGYVDMLHAWNYQLSYGAVQNKDGNAFIHAAATNMTAAARELSAAIPEDLTFDLTNKAGKDSYPICGAVWAVCYQNQPASDHKKVVDFLDWITHGGQRFAAKMSYAPLPEEFRVRVEKKLETIKEAE